MVGRDAELGILRGLWRETEQGEPRIAVVVGEAGLGKSRLIDAFRREIAGDSGAVVALGQCVEAATVAIPYAPLAGVLRSLGRELGMDAVIDAAGPGAAALRRLASGDPDRDGGGASMRLDEVITTVLETLSARFRLLVIVEDLHWADPATLDVLRFASRVQRTGRLLLGLTFRDDAPRDTGFREFVADLDRNPRSTRVSLERLSPREVRAQVHDLLGAVPPAEYARRIHERSDGVPFFVEELVAVDSPDESVPRPLRDVLLGRYESLPPAVQEVTRILAASQVAVEHALLVRLTDREPSELDDFLRQAIEAGLLRTDGHGYDFRHALTREAVAAELLPGERERVHARYAEILESERDEPGTRTSRAVRIANHWYEAGDTTRAFASALTGMEASLDAYAYAGAARLGERALEMWDSIPDAESVADRTRIDLLAAVGAAWRTAGEVARARTAIGQALTALAADEDPRMRATLLMDLATLHDSRIESIGDLEQAIGLLDGTAAATQRAAAQAELAFHYMIAGRTDEAIEVATAVLDAAPPDARRSRSFAANLRGSTLVHRGSIEAGLADFETARIEAQADTDALIRYHVNFSDALFMLGRHAESIEVAEAGLEVAAAAGVERTMGSMLALNIVDPSFAIGEWDRADLLIESFLEQEPPGSFRAYLRRARIRSALWRGDLPEAVGMWREWEDALDAIARAEGQARANQAIDFADLHLAAGDLDRAWGFAAQLLELPRLGTAPQELPLAPAAARVIAARRREAGDPGIQAADEDRIRAVIDRDEWPTQGMWRALTAAELGGPDRAGSDPELWIAARAAAESPETPVLNRLLVEFGLARALVATGDRRAAAAVLGELRISAETTGARLLLQWADDLSDSAGLAKRSRSRADTAAGLTGRERQVLDLVAEGLTNGQIAERLFLSPKTVSVHVSAILRKLGAATRTEAVRVWMLRQEGS
jgi:DNA-binding CsgD family transcriptional regulator